MILSKTAIVHEKNGSPFRRVSHLESYAREAARRGETVVAISYIPHRGLVLRGVKYWQSHTTRERFYPRALSPSEAAEANRLLKEEGEIC
jgi:hypothetical protein